MRGTDEGDEHLNMKGAVCDLLNPQAVHLQGIDPITQKNRPYKQGIKPPAQVVYYQVTFKHHALIMGHYTHPPKEPE